MPDCTHSQQRAAVAASTDVLVAVSAVSQILQEVMNALLKPGEDPTAWSDVAATLHMNPTLTRGAAGRLRLLEVAVDAFLAHDFSASAPAYAAYALITAAQEACEGRPASEGVEYFMQWLLAPAPEGGITPWGTRYLGQPRGDAAAARLRAFDRLHSRVKRFVSGEGKLLADMQANPDITCECLNVEDPYHPAFGTGAPPPRVVTPSKKVRPYMLDCAACGVAPERGTDFKWCSRCSRVRYCGPECQAKHWPSHRADCGRKVAPWWGRAHNGPSR